MADNESDNTEDFQGQFLEDYYAECYEHLSLVRRHLLAIESQIAEGTVDVTLLDELFRSFHTIKGISGMVGLSTAEQLAHSIEGMLRSLRQAELAMSVGRLDSLIAGASLLDQLIAAHRAGQPLPDIRTMVERLSESESRGPGDTPALHFGPPNAGPEKTAAGIRSWIVEFTPTPALAERGININSVRGRLQEVADIVKATPHVKGEGEISFQFVVKARDGITSLQDWGEDGLTVTPLEEGPEEAIPAAQTTRIVQASTPKPAAPAANVVRVDLARLDELMRMVAEMVTNRARLEAQVKSARQNLPSAEWRGLWETTQTMGRQLRDLREGVMAVRMVQVGEIFERMQFVVRDLARESGKRIVIELIGRETEIDKFLVERMMDPLLHLVRNAVSHGLERPDEREAQGKYPEGRLTLRAATTGENVIIQIGDDGRGIDRDRVAEKARTGGLLEQQGLLDDNTLLDLICLPGFSTRTSADRESGRGVGMDVVKKIVEGLSGTLSVSTETGKGTTFTIGLPLTLAIADALIVDVRKQTFAVPQSVVREVIEVQPSEVRALENNEMIVYRDGALPLLRLSKVFNLPDSQDSAQRAFHVFVTGTGNNAVGVAVDRVVGQREIVVRGLNDRLAQSPGIAGATDLGDDRVVLILDVAALRRAGHAGQSSMAGRQN